MIFWSGSQRSSEIAGADPPLHLTGDEMTNWWEQVSEPERQEPPRKKRKYHIGMWLFLLLQVLFLVWICVGLSTSNCHGQDADACSAGTAIGIGVVLLLWAVADVISGSIWLIVYLARRK